MVPEQRQQDDDGQRNAQQPKQQPSTESHDESSGWFGVLAPAGTPREIVDRMQAELAKAFATTELQGLWNGLGADTPNLYGDAFGKFAASETKRWAEVVKNSGAKLE